MAGKGLRFTKEAVENQILLAMEEATEPMDHYREIWVELCALYKDFRHDKIKRHDACQKLSRLKWKLAKALHEKKDPLLLGR